MTEIWKIIPNYQGIYIVSNLGRVKNNRHTIIKGNPICLFLNGKRNCVSIHLLVATNFIPNPNNYPSIIHIDGDKNNNNVNNLKWGNHNKKIIQLDLYNKFIANFNSVTEAVKITGLTNIPSVLNGKYSQTGGFIFKYFETDV